MKFSQIAKSLKPHQLVLVIRGQGHSASEGDVHLAHVILDEVRHLGVARLGLLLPQLPEGCHLRGVQTVAGNLHVVVCMGMFNVAT